ncbi:uncharacterized protein LOC106661574 [Cimex lectularius]|uniref:Uncharacterized protein n=1 Tax=Cimex lectularius TaxID=79782 RepID=A0A8I6RA16_CIMLE|nr:uncharacterized protein LOC106661574 [Cimex lectularius]
MATTTLVVLLVASFCLLGESAPVNPGQVKSYVYASRGRTSGFLNSALKQALHKQMVVSDEEQKKCVAKTGAYGVVVGQKRLTEVTDQLLGEYQMVDSTVDFVEVQQNVDAAFKQVSNEVLQATLVEMNKC